MIRACLIILLSLAFAAEVLGASLQTSPVKIGSGASEADDIQCNVSNASKRDVEVVIEFRNADSTVLSSTTAPLGPGEGWIMGGGLSSGAVYCHFSLKGSARKVRAAMVVLDSVDTPLVIEVAR